MPIESSCIRLLHESCYDVWEMLWTRFFYVLPVVLVEESHNIATWAAAPLGSSMYEFSTVGPRFTAGCSGKGFRPVNRGPITVLGIDLWSYTTTFNGYNSKNYCSCTRCRGGRYFQPVISNSLTVNMQNIFVFHIHIDLDFLVFIRHHDNAVSCLFS